VSDEADRTSAGSSGGSSFSALGWPVGGPADIMGGQLQLGPM